MKKHIVIISIAILLSTILLSGCNEETNNIAKKTFIGSWKIDHGPSSDDVEIWVFNENHTGSNSFNEFTGNFRWEDTGSELCIWVVENPSEKRCGTYTFSNDNKEFTWSDPQGLEIVFKRQ